MNFTTSKEKTQNIQSDLLVVFAADENGSMRLSDAAASLDKSLTALLTRVMKEESFVAKKHETVLLHTHHKIAASRILVMGIGNPSDITSYDIQIALAVVIKQAKTIHAAKIAVCVDPNFIPVLSVEPQIMAMTEGCVLGSYEFKTYKKKDKKEPYEGVSDVVYVVSPSEVEVVTQTLSRAQITARAVTYARDLINESPSITTPSYLAECAKNIADNHPDITCTILQKKDMEKLCMGGLLAIARGSEEEPAFIHLTHNIGAKKTITIVGKGITFDTGGLSLKPPGSMETMKMDMAGAATVLAIFSVLSSLPINVNVEGLISATENMPSGTAIKPGDVVRAMNGKTIEILNTDAEGRVVLADALSYAGSKLRSDAIIDIATLTGACVVALGEDIAGVFVNNDPLRDELKKAADATGERIWELPLVEEYKELLKSSVADIKNVAKTRYGGAIEGALFLEEFVPEKTPWAHIDIAGPAFAEKDTPLTPYGGTGFSVRLLLHYLQSQK